MTNHESTPEAQPFIPAQDRRDILANLARASQQRATNLIQGLIATQLVTPLERKKDGKDETSDGKEKDGSEHKQSVDVKVLDIKTSKEGKDAIKEGKDKEGKDGGKDDKEGKDQKDSKEGKEGGKDQKDGKEGKEGKDSKDGDEKGDEKGDEGGGGKSVAVGFDEKVGDDSGGSIGEETVVKFGNPEQLNREGMNRVAAAHTARLANLLGGPPIL